MKEYGVKVNYLFHSSFAVETKNYFLIFDYFMDSVEKGDKCLKNGAVGPEDLNKNKKIIVFSSHSHGDHFNPVILSWRNIREDIEYVLSSDIGIEESGEKIHVMSAYEELKIDDAYIKAYGSTDIGISFLVRLDGISLFHAGDLNWWYWWDDTPEEIERAESWFKEEIDRIKGERVDIAFFPVDPRLEHNYHLGAEYFVNEIAPSVIVPMHFAENHDICKRFADKMKNASVRVVEITHRGQEFQL